jgi:hypothetical protein
VTAGEKEKLEEKTISVIQTGASASGNIGNTGPHPHVCQCVSGACRSADDPVPVTFKLKIMK